MRILIRVVVGQTKEFQHSNSISHFRFALQSSDVTFVLEYFLLLD